ncbi:WLM-domain-containing protein [Crucibulum laeve]|uniref:WLM-domain-containing protein n=1 Tax=Crucibulum laeve TaxID=68775 RepID=A0A5C3M3D2_9AGAR|nr:WLM-domain-containing protein [Crucibulum laeve]
MASSDNSISLTVSYRGTPHALSLLPDSTLAALRARLEELTSVPPSLQKLLYKGKKASGSDNEELTLAQVGLKNGMKVQMLGSTAQELGGMKAVEDEQKKRERIMRERALKAPVKVRSTGPSPNSMAAARYRFHELVPLAHLPNPDGALELLRKLSEDPAIRHIMHKHEFSVGVLTELAPHEHPELLGLNVNAGEAIKLRLRTDRYDGFRTYKEVRKVLCHELTHNVWGDHDNNAQLNSKLNRQVVEFERSMTAGTHYLSGGPDVDMYQPTSELEAEAQSYVLGGNRSTVPSSVNDSVEERRRRVLDATMNRLRKEEEELEHSCGTGRSTTT